MLAATPIRELLTQTPPDTPVVAQGWVRTRRDLKDLCFLELNDGSCLANLQVLVPKTSPLYELAAGLHTGSAIAVQGLLVASPAKGQRVELQAESITLYGDANPETYPLQKKRHSFEFLRTIAHLRPRTNTFGAIARIRNHCAMAIHQFFQERGFVWVHTPILTASDCEGAGELFTVTNLPLHQLPRNEQGEIDFRQDFFGRRAYLTVSGQLEAEIMATALTKVYTFGPTFRAENSNTSRHLAEFWMIEPEVAFCDLAGDMDLAEAFLQHVFRYVLEHDLPDLEFFQQRIEPTVLTVAERMAEQPFERMSYTEAIAYLKKSGKNFEYPVEWGLDLQSEHERYLAEELCKKPVIVYDYPKDIKAFYMRLNDDEKTVAAMDVLVPRVGELIGGSQREERYDVLLRRIEACGLDPAAYWWYLDLRRYGTVPHAGFGLGFERLIQFMTGMGNIRDVIPFPRTPDGIDF
ncbi:MAG: asparagine--tRNA ligase [Gloeomargarita sp. SKYBB_i_bin120]|nr:asparagine--tRNA ligase [Gloeomargarita sp. SKYG98]MCS7292658.1 asparagine--tRNA ligase [Gloeomargarita sp. SKYB120]MDW8178220.1 asparagine--tRNA ligase [Gloeomargarita sp. SKYBB_i_bin120]